MAGGRVSTISSGNRGPLLNIASWICTIAMSIVVASKLATRILKMRRLQSDDYFIASSMLVAIIECILSYLQTTAGLGRHFEDVTEIEKDRLQKAIYAAQILYVAALYLTRLGVFRFLLLLTVSKGDRRIVHSWTVFAVTCGVAMELTLTFYCSPPLTWAVFSGKCMDEIKFWTAELALGTLLDAVLAFLPIYFLYDVHLPRSKKTYIMGTFLVRLLVIPLAVLRRLSMDRLHSSADPSSESFMPALYTQIHMNMTIIISCIPFMKPFTDSLQTGILASDLHALTRGTGIHGGYVDRIKLRELGKSVSTGSGSAPSKRRWVGGSLLDTTGLTRVEETSRQQSIQDGGSRGTSEERLVIRQTTTIAVETQDREELVGL